MTKKTDDIKNFLALLDKIQREHAIVEIFDKTGEFNKEMTETFRDFLK